MNSGILDKPDAVAYRGSGLAQGIGQCPAMKERAKWI
jgi:hypothetical protein